MNYSTDGSVYELCKGSQTVEMLQRDNCIERQMRAEHDCTLIITWEDLSEHDKRRQPQALQLAEDN